MTRLLLGDVGDPMSQVYNPESDVIAEIERLEMEARSIRRRVEHAHTENDKRVLNRQLQELKDQIQYLKTRLP
jgi:predicted nuclease with TOPRIM domain